MILFKLLMLRLEMTSWFRLTLLAIAIAIVSSVALSCSAETDWIQYRGPDGAGYTANRLYPPLGRKWIFRLQQKTKPAQSFNPPAVSDDTLYFGSYDKNFYAFDLRTGYRLWSFATGNHVNSIPHVDKDRIYFGSNDGKVYAVNRVDGKKIWEFQTGHTVQSLISRYGETIIFTSDRGNTYFLDLNGKERYRVPNPHWMHHSYQVRNGIIYWMPRGRNFGPYNIKTRRFLDWEEILPRDGRMHWYSFPALDSQGIYYGSSSYHPQGGLPRLSFKARRLSDGQTLWINEDVFAAPRSRTLTMNVAFRRHMYLLDYMAPAIYGDAIIFASGDTVLRAYHRESGKTLWKKRFPRFLSSAPTVAGDRIYIGIRGEEDSRGEAIRGGKKPKLLCLSARDGDKLWEMEIEGAILSAPVVVGKRLMFGTSSYLFYVLEEIL